MIQHDAHVIAYQVERSIWRSCTLIMSWREWLAFQDAGLIKFKDNAE